MDREKVIKGFTVCSEHGLLNGEDCHGHYEYTDNLADIIKANDYSKQCPYNGCRTGCVKTLARDTLAMLKEQEKTRLEIAHEMVSNSILMYQGKELVRCKDCKYGQYEEWDNGECVDKTVYCDGYGIHKPDWFCVDGRKRDDT